MSYEIITPIDKIKSKLETAVNVLNTARLLIPSDKPLTLKSIELVSSVIQTREFQELAAFAVDLVDLVTKHFAHKIKT